MILNLKKEIRAILNSEKGVALLMIMTSIIILMAIYGEFTFESKIARIKATNILDRSQAKLLAESGLQLTMARLRLYKEAYNKIQGNEDAKKMVPAQLLNQLWEVPFMYPVPVLPGATRTFKDTVEKFQTESLLEGEMKVNIQNISNRLNLNLLRLDTTQAPPEAGTDEEENAKARTVEEALMGTLKRLVDDKKAQDELFEDRYGDLNYEELLANLKYYISDFQSMNQDPHAGELETIFEKIPLTPKYGPLASSSELYTIPGWNDEIIELIQNEFGAYPSAQIDLNKISANMLRIIIPSITDDEIREFFLYRDDPVDPKLFNSQEDFKQYIVTQARILSESEFDSRMKVFELKGISFGPNPNLFRVISEGTYNRSVYTLVAYVVLPQAPRTPTTTTGGAGGGGTTGAPAGDANKTGQLLEPRIIEIQVN